MKNSWVKTWKILSAFFFFFTLLHQANPVHSLHQYSIVISKEAQQLQGWDQYLVNHIMLIKLLKSLQEEVRLDTISATALGCEPIVDCLQSFQLSPVVLVV